MFIFFFLQAEDGIRDLVRSRGLGDVYKRQTETIAQLVEVAVDLSRTASGQGDEGELRIDAIEELLDLRVDHGVERTRGHLKSLLKTALQCTVRNQRSMR